jgi:hypothetical protein
MTLSTIPFLKKKINKKKEENQGAPPNLRNPIWRPKQEKTHMINFMTFYGILNHVFIINILCMMEENINFIIKGFPYTGGLFYFHI